MNAPNPGPRRCHLEYKNQRGGGGVSSECPHDQPNGLEEELDAKGRHGPK